MNLAEHRFFGPQRVTKLDDHGERFTVYRFGYESTGKGGVIYDVEIWPDPPDVTFVKNMRPSNECPIHRAVYDKYYLQIQYLLTALAEGG